ncbi:TerD family protein [Cryobacterium psychrophilum]|uniref:TerD family protein n=1 Tax=Cryobacterium psychrophilum TaxID=41988 RepID=A0A4Y8KN53_9MICO|nr:TerD family protein [Cryobacterium psychrophilum]TDW31284.1 tellurium resistance protein TerZ [Cryobacterium psychrophilum]TFD78428.1 TerD family protein [Cryobacterium psychrophilum]
MALSLSKHESLSLVKSDSTPLTAVVLGLGWDAAPKKGLFAALLGGGGGDDIDLDASAILLDSNNKLVDTVWFQQLQSKDASIRHSGDNLTGDGDGDDERINIDLAAVSSNVTSIVLVVTSFQGQTFDKVRNVFARVVDNSTGRESEVVRYNLADAGKKTASVIAKLTRSGAGWTFTALGNSATGRKAPDLIGEAQAAA